MELIYKVTDMDISNELTLLNNPDVRYGARGIVINDKGEIALFNKSNKNEYKLPGGGVEGKEASSEAFKREVFEETGCKVEIIDFLGTIEEIKTKDSFKQMSYVYVAKVVEDTKALNVTEQEAKEGARLFWETPEKALELITESFDKIVASPCEEDGASVYHTKFIVKRDKKILETYLKTY